MKILVSSFKGGVGKTAIATNLALHLGCQYVTNDLSLVELDNTIRIETGKKRIPKELTKMDDIVFDFGAMSTQMDSKVTQAAKLCDVIVIPTRPDPRSIAATITTYDFFRRLGKPIVVIINHVVDERKYDAACVQLREALGPLRILKIRQTTLFDRVSVDGVEWF